MFQTKYCIENQNAHFMFNSSFPANRAVCEIMWENIVDSDRIQKKKTIRHMHFAVWIHKATNTQSEYVILITFPLQQWLSERSSMLRL